MESAITAQSPNRVETGCYHCGAPTAGRGLTYDGKEFCCAGCKTVYEILSRNAMCEFYDLASNPGITPSLRPAPKFVYLDDPTVIRQLVDFSNDELSVVNFHIPQMHCSSCIWLLENLHKLNNGVLFSRVDFMKRRLLVRYSNKRTTLRTIVELLASLGYEPELNFGSLDAAAKPATDRNLYVKIGVAAFCFGNIMLFSLPEYFDAQRQDMASREFFAYLNLLLSAPVVLFSASVFFVSAFQGLRKRLINIDVPIALGIGLIFARSAVDVLVGGGPGYFDSLTGLVFFLLLGRLFQNKTYENLSFERTYQSYFPLAVTVKRGGGETTTPITSLRPGERIIIRNNEVIPADAVVMNGVPRIDYSFVTGESDVSAKNVGDLVYAGGKQIGSAIELEVIKEVSRSTFVQLWNNVGSSDRTPARLMTLSNSLGKWFTVGILLVAAAAALGWSFLDPSRILDAVTAILIVACPCALALAAPFTFGTAMRIYGQKGFYLKNSSVVEALARIDTIVFDKTGTLTHTKSSTIRFVEKELTPYQKSLIASLAQNSMHPLSRAIADHYRNEGGLRVDKFEEFENRGMNGLVDGHDVRMGSAEFVGAVMNHPDPEHKRTRVFVAIGTQKLARAGHDPNQGDAIPRILGWFEFENTYRTGLGGILSVLGGARSLRLLSGDSDGERQRLMELYPRFDDLQFGKNPAEKLEYVRSLQGQSKRVLMFGDGLNDAGALWQSDVGVAVSEDVNTFSPACDAMLDAGSFPILDKLVSFSSTSMRVVQAAIALSVVYNVVGLWFAVRAELSPLLAAILMPLSSISVVVFSTVATRFLARRRGLG